MTSQSIVRLADPKDEDAIFELCRMMHAENGLSPMDDDLVRETMKNGIERKGGVLGIIGPVGGPLEAIIYMTISNFWYSRKPHLFELLSFVHPEHRKSNHAKALIEFAKKCATQDIRLVIGITSNKRTEAKIRLYERRLGKSVGAMFLYPPAPQNNATQYG